MGGSEDLQTQRTGKFHFLTILSQHSRPKMSIFPKKGGSALNKNKMLIITVQLEHARVRFDGMSVTER